METSIKGNTITADFGKIRCTWDRDQQRITFVSVKSGNFLKITDAKGMTLDGFYDYLNRVKIDDQGNISQEPEPEPEQLTKEDLQVLFKLLKDFHYSTGLQPDEQKVFIKIEKLL